MPLPLIGLLVVGATKIAAAMKAAAIAKTGAAVIVKYGGGKALVTKAVMAAGHSIGWGSTIAYGTIITLSAGAATVMFNRARALKAAIEQNDKAAAVQAASSLCREITGHAGLDDASRLLHDFIDAGGGNLPIVERVSAMLDELIQQLSRRLA